MHKLLFIFFLIYIINSNLVLADPPYSYCPAATNITSSNNSFQTNTASLLHSLSSNASFSKFYNMSVTFGNSTAYGLYLCYDYVSLANCRSNIDLATQAMTRLCSNSTDAIVWEELSQLRISNHNFFGKLDLNINISKYNKKLVSEPEKFRSIVNTTLYDLAQRAAFNSSAHFYATQSVAFSNTQRVYSLVQCTPDLSPIDCHRCLQNGITDVLSLDKYKFRGGRLLSKSCYLRYEFYTFYAGNTVEDSKGQSNQGKQLSNTIILSIGQAFVVAVLLCMLELKWL